MAFNLLDADRVWKYDLHVHTREVSPCGRMTIEEMGEAYERAGYDGIWLTNHLHRDFLEATAGMSWQERAETFLAPYRKAKRWERSRWAWGWNCGFSQTPTTTCSTE